MPEKVRINKSYVVIRALKAVLPIEVSKSYFRGLK
jgi:hypothetical protein